MRDAVLVEIRRTGLETENPIAMWDLLFDQGEESSVKKRV